MAKRSQKKEQLKQRGFLSKVRSPFRETIDNNFYQDNAFTSRYDLVVVSTMLRYRLAEQREG
jgi:hypothetical protein